MNNTSDGHEKELSSAEYVSPDLIRKYNSLGLKHSMLCDQRDLGMENITREMIDKSANDIIKTLLEICNTFTLEAFRTGSHEHRYNFPQFIRNTTGVERPCDPKIIEEMAASRRPGTGK